MSSNCAPVQISNSLPPTTLKEKKMIWMEKQMKGKMEKAKKVRDKVVLETLFTQYQPL
jgi:hypothetical protein